MACRLDPRSDLLCSHLDQLLEFSDLLLDLLFNCRLRLLGRLLRLQLDLLPWLLLVGVVEDLPKLSLLGLVLRVPLALYLQLLRAVALAMTRTKISVVGSWLWLGLVYCLFLSGD